MQNYDGETLVTDERESQKHASNLKTHIQAAREIFPNGSVYAGSVVGTVIGDGKDDIEMNRMIQDFGSVMGMDEHRRRQINAWRTEDPVPESMVDPFVSPVFVALTNTYSGGRRGQ